MWSEVEGDLKIEGYLCWKYKESFSVIMVMAGLKIEGSRNMEGSLIAGTTVMLKLTCLNGQAMVKHGLCY